MNAWPHDTQVNNAFIDSSAAELRTRISDLIKTMLVVTNKSRVVGVWLQIARCLGQIGAIDPSRINVSIEVEQVSGAPGHMQVWFSVNGKNQCPSPLLSCVALGRS